MDQTSDPRKKVVQAGYDAIADGYAAWGAEIEGDPRHRFLAEFARRLANGAHVLDLGCGAGVPSTQLLARRFAVVGVDISEVQLRLARMNAPRATFVHADFSELSLSDGTLDGVVALYSISHAPREQHPELFRRIAGWLKPGGLFLASLGSGDSADWTGEWLGVRMFFSSHDAEKNRTLLREAGFELEIDEIVEMREPGGSAAFLWVLARKEA